MPETLSEAEARLWHETPVYFFSWEDYFAWGAVAKLDPERSFRALRVSPLVEPAQKAEVSAKDVDAMLAQVNLWLSETPDLPPEVRVEGLRTPAATGCSWPQPDLGRPTGHKGQGSAAKTLGGQGLALPPGPHTGLAGPLDPHLDLALVQGQWDNDADLDELGQERIRFKPARRVGGSGPTTTHPCPAVVAHVQSPGLIVVAGLESPRLCVAHEWGADDEEVQPWAASRRPKGAAGDLPTPALEGCAGPYWALEEEGGYEAPTEGPQASNVNREAARLALVSALRPKAATPRPWKYGFASPLPTCPLATTLSAPATVGQIWPLGLPPLDLPLTPVDTLDLWRRGWMVSLVVRPHRWARYLRH